MELKLQKDVARWNWRQRRPKRNVQLNKNQSGLRYQRRFAVGAALPTPPPPWQLLLLAASSSYLSWLPPAPCFLPLPASSRSLLSTSPCFLHLPVSSRSLLATPPCFIPPTCTFLLPLSTPPCLLLPIFDCDCDCQQVALTAPQTFA